jgi:hypothetical protein
MVEEYGIAQIYDRDAWGEHFLAHWFRRFRLLRRLKVREMPSDQVRKGLPVSRLLDLIETHRANYAAVRVARLF